MRKVASAAGVKFFGVPIGTPITTELLDKAKSMNPGKLIPKGATAIAHVTSSNVVPTPPEGYLNSGARAAKAATEADHAARTAAESAAHAPKPFTVKTTGVLKGPDKFEVLGKRFSAPAGSKIFTPKSGSNAAFVADPEGDLHVFGPKGEVALSPAMEAELKSKMAAEKKNLKDITPSEPNVDSTPKPDAKAGDTTTPKPDPTGSTGLFHEHDPSGRAAGGSAAENTPLHELLPGKYKADDNVTIYRGVPKGTTGEPQPGDWVTTNKQLAKDYAGTGDVISSTVKAKDLRGEKAADPTNNTDEELVYTPSAAAEAPKTPEKPSSDTTMKTKDGREIKLHASSGPNGVQVTAEHQGKSVGSLLATSGSAEKEHKIVLATTNSDFRRQGIATAMLNHAQAHSDKPVVHATGDALSADGAAFAAATPIKEKPKAPAASSSASKSPTASSPLDAFNSQSTPTKSPEVGAVAASVYEKHVAAEPAITSQMQALSSEFGAPLYGLDFRLKEKGSLERKIATDAEEKQISAEDAAARISDAVRYTMHPSAEKYAETAAAVLKKLDAEGYHVDKAKNFWLSTGQYRGINVQITTPDGVHMELQFHTPKSQEVKDANHLLYEQFRVLDPIKDAAKRSALDAEMRSAWESLQVPANVHTVGTPVNV